MLLILVHVEDSFSNCFPRNYIRNLRLLLPRYEVLHCTSQINDYGPIEEIAKYVDHEIEWAWGYEPTSFMTKTNNSI